MIQFRRHGRCIRVLTVVDQYTRECLTLHADVALSGEKVAAALDTVVALRGAPKSITVESINSILFEVGPDAGTGRIFFMSLRMSLRLAIRKPRKDTAEAIDDEVIDCLGLMTYHRKAPARAML